MTLLQLWKQLSGTDLGTEGVTAEAREKLQPSLRRIVRRALRVPRGDRGVTEYIHGLAARVLEETGWNAADLVDCVCEAVWSDLRSLSAGTRSSRQSPAGTIFAGGKPTIRVAGA